MSNQVTLIGRISSELTYDHEFYGEKYYRATVSVERTSGTVDDIPVMVSDRLINVRENYLNEYVAIRGQFRSYNLHEALKTRLLLYVFAVDLEIVEPEDINDVFLEGVITNQPNYRETPLGREIADVTLAVNRAYGKNDYIPCICWGRTARYLRYMKIGDSIRVAGRVQSRQYNKAGETKTAYEVSVNLLESVS